MKRIILAGTLLAMALSISLAQKPPVQKKIKQVEVSATTVSRQPAGKRYTLDLTRAGTIYNLPANADYSRVQVRTANGEMTMADLLKKTGKTTTGKLRVGMTSDIRTQKLALSRIGGGTLNIYNCEGLLCTCSGDVDCNDMFNKAGCGDIAVCDERGCWCLRI